MIGIFGKRNGKVRTYTTEELADKMKEVDIRTLKVPVSFANKVRAIGGTTLSRPRNGSGKEGE